MQKHVCVCVRLRMCGIGMCTCSRLIFMVLFQPDKQKRFLNANKNMGRELNPTALSTRNPRQRLHKEAIVSVEL